MEEGKDDLRLAFHLKPHHQLSQEYQNLKPHVLIDYTFLDTMPQGQVSDMLMLIAFMVHEALEIKAGIEKLLSNEETLH